jgi:hypothetical protein
MSIRYSENMNKPSITTITKVKKNAVSLPRRLRKAWNEANIAVVAPPQGDTLILKRVQKPVERLSEIARRNTLRPMKRQAVNREIAAYRSGQ